MGTDANADAANIVRGTGFTIYADSLAKSVNRTRFYTAQTVDALITIPKQYGCFTQGLRVGAPAATEGTAFKEHQRTNARAVVEAVFLDIEKIACNCHT